MSLVLFLFSLFVSGQCSGIFHLYNVTNDPTQEARDSQNQKTNNDGCYVGGRYLKFGDQWTQNGICGIFSCQEKHYRNLATPCPHLRYQEGSGCRIIEENLTMDFPACCPKMFCPNEKQNVVVTQKPSYSNSYMNFK